ncbi:GEVED domain-containing protein [Streptomyces niveiscabiei]|uniref:DUF7927 domain-containing protein n=1 Tax=Streptomyces niveiscabiei TaxID=164115 RepID=UPI0029B4FF4A|nr:LPXTG cell wall anchor domain-containing protein [Streptomyces niveiscabiei]MDX3386646.1 GEVED domain-containing protein [Streptomyces niveiscabiei]
MFAKVTHRYGRLVAAFVALALGTGAAPALGQPSGPGNPLGTGRAVLLADWPGGASGALGKTVEDSAGYRMESTARRSAGDGSPATRWSTVELPESVAGRQGARGLRLPAPGEGRPYSVTLTLPEARPGWLRLGGLAAGAVTAVGKGADGEGVRPEAAGTRALTSVIGGKLAVNSLAGADEEVWGAERSAEVVFREAVRSVTLTVGEGNADGVIVAGPFGTESGSSDEDEDEAKAKGKAKAEDDGEAKTASAAPREGAEASAGPKGTATPGAADAAAKKPGARTPAAKRPGAPRAPASRRANVNFPVDEPFTGTSSTLNNHWTIAGSANVGNGWLNLTPATNNQAGSAIMQDSFNTNLGVLVDFDYNISGGSGAGDGFSVFLMDGSSTNLTPGASGAGLGYACGNVYNTGSGNVCHSNGVPNAYVGIGFDAYGNFSGTLAGNGPAPGNGYNKVAIRGSGNGTSGYKFVTNAAAPGGLRMTNGTTTRHVQLLIQGSTVSVWLADPTTGAMTEIITNANLASVSGQAALPATFHLGFAASTGAATEVHKLKNVVVTLPVDAQISKSGPSQVNSGSQATYTVTATNNSDSINTVQNGSITDTVPSNFTNVTWTCSASGGASCASASGSGNNINAGVTLPAGGTTTLTVTGTATTAGTVTNTANLVLPAQYSNINAANPLSASVNTTIIADDFDVTKSGGSAATAPGNATTIPVVVANNGPNNAQSNATVTVTMPQYVIANSTQPSGCSVNSNGTQVTCTVQASQLTNGASVNLPISVTVYSSAPGNTALTAPNGIQVTGTLDAVSSNNQADAVVNTSSSVADLNVAKSANPTQVNYGSNTTFTLTVTNNGPSATSNVQVTDQLPSGLTYVSDDSNGAYNSGTGVWNVGSLPLGQSATIHITATVNSTSPQTNRITQATSSGSDPTPCATGSTANCASATVTPVAADLATTKTATGTPIAPGQTFQYQITTANNGPSAATNVTVTDTLPSQLTFVSSSSGCTASGQTVTCPQIASLANGASQTNTITVKVPSSYTGNGGDIQNTASSMSAVPDPTPGNNTSQPSSPQVSGPVTDLYASKVLNTTQAVPPGSNVQYTIWANNGGPSDATGVTVTDTLPAGMTYVSGPSNCSASGQTVTCTGIGLGANVGKALPITVKIASSYTGNGSDIPNQATESGGNGTDPNPDNNTTAQVPPNVGPASADLSTAKQAASSTPISPGQTFAYTITTSNAGPSDAQQVAVTDALPSQLTFVSSSTGCTASGQNVTCPAIATLANGASQTNTITVRLSPSYTGNGSDIGNVATSNSPTGDPNPNNNSSSPAPPPPVNGPQTALSISKAGSATSYQPGQSFSYTVTVSNAGPSAAAGVTVADTLPAPMSSFTWTCTASGTGSACGAASGSGNLSDKPTVGVDGTLTYVLSGTVATSASGQQTNTATVTAPSGDTDANCQSTCRSTVTTNGPNITMSKSSSPHGAKPGQTVTYTVTMTNNGQGDASSFRFDDDLKDVADDATFVDGSITSNPAGGTGSYDASNAALSWTGPVPAGQTVTVTYQFTVDSPPDGNGVLNNDVYADGTNCAPGTNDGDCTDNNGGGTPRITLSKVANPQGPVSPGQTVGYTVTLTNATAFDYPGASFQDDLTDVLDDATYNNDASASAGTASYSEPTLSWTGTVPANSSVTVTYSVVVDNPDDGNAALNNTVTSTTDTNCGDGSTDPKCAETVQVGRLDITKSVSNSTPKPGDQVTYTVTVENTGTGTYSGATFTDDLTDVVDDATYNNDENASIGTGTYSAPKLTWTGDVPAGQTATITYSVTVDNPDTGNKTLTNAVTSPSGSNCGTGSTDPGCSTSSGSPQLTLTKTFSPANPVAGQKVTYTVVAQNTGTATYTGATWSDDLSDLIDDGTYGNDASATSGTVNYSAPKLTWNGDLAAGASSTTTYSVLLGDPMPGNKQLTNKVTSTLDTNCGSSSTSSACGNTTPQGVGQLQIAKTVDNSAPKPGDTVHYTVTVQNNGTGVYDGATFTDDLTDVIDDATYNNDAGATDGTVSYTSPKVTWSDDLAAGATATITYSATVNDPDTGNQSLGNSVVSTAGSNCAQGAQAASCSTKSAVPQLNITKSASDTTPQPGEKVTYTVTLTNPGTADYTGATFTDDLTDVIDDAAYDNDAGATAGTASYSAPKVNWTGTVPAGGTVTVTYSATVDSDPAQLGNGVLKNAVTSTSPGSNCATASGTGCSTTSNQVPTLSITKKQTSTGQATPGSKVTYQVTVDNPTNSTYTNASYTDDLTKILDDATYNADANASAGSVSYSSPKLTWTGDVPGGQTVTLTYSVTVNDPDTGDKQLSNTVVGPAGSNCRQGSTDPGCSSVPAGVPTLTMRKTVSPANPVPGQTLTYTVTLTNTGTADYDGATFTDDLTKVLDDATWLNQTNAAGGTLSYSAPKLTWTGDVLQGQTRTVTYAVQVDDPDTGDGQIDNAVVGPAGSNCEQGSTSPDCSANIDGVPALNISKTMSPNAPLQGQKATYTVTVKNTGTATYPNASYTDDLTKVLDDAAYNNDANASAGSVSYSSPKLTWTGTLAAGATATITYSVTVNNPDTGDKQLINAVTGPAGSNCEQGSTDSACSTGNDPGQGVPQLTLTKTSSPANPVAGQKVTYTVVAQNTGTATYSGATWSDDLSDLIDDGTYDDDASATTGSVSYAEPKLTWTGDLAAGASVTTTYSVLLGNPMPGNKQLTNTVVSTPDTNCGPSSTSSACGNRTPQGVPQLTMKKTASSSTATPGSTVTYTVTVQNSGTAAYDDASWSDDLTDVIDDATYNNDVNASTGSASYNAPKVTWTGDLAAGQTATITYSVTVNDPDTGNQQLTNTVVSDVPGSNCGSGSTDSSCTSGPLGVPQLAITKTVSPTTPIPGNTLTYTVTLKNTGTADYAGATFTDDLTKVLDDATWLNRTTASTGTVSYAAPKVTWTGDVPQGQSETVTYAVEVDDPDTGDKQINNSVVGPPGSNCEQGSTDSRCTADIPGVPELHITKTQSPATPTAGQKVTYTVTVDNTGTADYPNATFTDDLTDVIDDAAYGNDANATTGTASYTSPKVSWTGDVPAGQTATITYSATVNNPDTGNQQLANSVVGPQGSNCEAGKQDADCTSTSGVGRLQITKTYSPSNPLPGDTVTYTVNVTNTGTATYTGASWDDDLTGVLDDAAYNNDASVTGGSVNYTSPKLSWSGNLTPKATATITYSVTVDDPDTGDGKLANTVVGPQGSNCPAGSTDPDCSPAPAGVPQLSITKAASATNPKPGDKVTYTVTLTNAGQAPYPNATTSDDLTGVLDDAAYDDDANASAGSVSYASPKVTWTGTVPAGGTVTVTYSVTVNTPDTGDHKLVNSVAGPQGSNCEAGKQNAACTTSDDPGNGIPDLSLSKTSSDPTPEPGDTVTYTITAKNQGTAVYTGAQWSDDLTGVLDDAAYNNDANASLGTVGYSSPTLSWTGDVPAGQTATITYSVTVNSPDTGDKKLTNAVVSTPDTNCPASSTDPDCGSNATGGIPSLTITKSSSTTNPLPGQQVTYTVTVQNTGTATFPGATFTDDLTDVIDDAAYGNDADATSGTVSYASPKVTWTGDVLAGATVTVTYSATVKSDPAQLGNGVLKNAVTSTSAGNNCATPSGTGCSTTSSQVPTLRIAKTQTTTQALPGDTVGYQITITNPTTSDYPNASYTDDLTGVLDDAAYNNDANATAGTTTYASPKLTWSGDVPGGQTVTLTYSVTVNTVDTGDGDLANTVVANVPGSNCAAGSTSSGCTTGGGNSPNGLIPHLKIVKTVDNTNPLPGDLLNYTVTVTNDSQAAYPAATFTDQVTQGTGLINQQPVTPPTASEGTISARSGFTYTWTGDMPAGATATITYTYMANAVPGSGNRQIVNQITGASANTTCYGNTTTPGYPTGCGATVVAPLYNFGEAPDSYGTTTTADGAYHVIVPGLGLGNGPQADLNGSPDGPRLDQDSGRGPTSIPTAYASGTGYRTQVELTNTTGAATLLAAWLDYDFDGVFEQGERITRTIPVNATTTTLSWPDADFAKAGTTYMRLRLYGEQVPAGRDPQVPSGETLVKVGGKLRAVPFQKAAVPADPKPTGYGGAGQVEDFKIPVAKGELDVKITSNNPNPKPGDKVTYTITVCSPTGVPYTGATASANLSQVLKYATYGNDAHATTGAVNYSDGKVSWQGTAPAGCAHPAKITFTVTYRSAPPSGTKVDIPVTGGPSGSNCPPGSRNPDCTAVVEPRPAPGKPLPDTGGDLNPLWLALAGCVTAAGLALLHAVRRRRG